MNHLPDIANSIFWPLVVLIVAVVFFFIFKNRLTGLKLDPARRKMRLKFGQRVKQAQGLAKRMRKIVAVGGRQSTVERIAIIGSQKSREVVVEAWGSLKQTVFDAAAVYRIRLTPSTNVQTVLSQMVELGALDTDASALISILNDLGQELITDSGLVPHIDDARAYTLLTDVIVGWMMLELNSNCDGTKQTEPQSSLTATVIGDYSSAPAAGQPTANLVGIKGVLNGRSIPIDSAEFKIGSGPDNDLQIKGDKYVSARHALIHYKNGSLFIADLNSRNGTYLNNKQVREAVTVLQPGDHIRMGRAVFRLNEPTTGGTNQSPPSNPTPVS